MNVKISVIIPLYNKEPEIKRTLDSVLSQTFQNFEVIVVNDHSVDGGPAVVKSYQDSRISIIDQDHRGVSYTRNHGVERATSDLIAFLDADDEWMPKHLETIIRLIEKFPGAGLYTTACEIRNREGKIQGLNYEYIPKSPWEGILPNYFRSGALGSNPVNSSVVVIPKKIFQAMGGFPEGYCWGEDVDLFGKIALKYPVAFSWENGGIYHWDALNRASDRITMIKYEDEPFIATANSALSRGEVPQEFIEPIKEFIAKRKIFRAVQYVHAGYPNTARMILRQCNTRWFINKKMKWLILATLPYPLFLFFRDSRRKIIRIFWKK